MNPRLLMFLCAALATACDQAGKERETGSDTKKEQDVRELVLNQGLANQPGALYRFHQDSKIRWQPWSRRAFDLASASNKLVMAVVVMSNDPKTAGALDELDSRRLLANEINSNYIPVLIDASVVREWMSYSMSLYMETRSPLKYPMLVWLTPDACPVAWIPLNEDIPGQDIETMFSSSHAMVLRIMQDDSTYVFSNSKRDQENRTARILQNSASKLKFQQEGADVCDALRQLVSLYDVNSRSFDEAGGSFPVGSMEILAQGARLYGLPENLRERVENALGKLSEDLVRSAMFDPLDGGVFGVRSGLSWKFPLFYKCCEMQARVVGCLADAYMVTGKEDVLESALGVLSYAESMHQDQFGLFGNFAAGTFDMKEWMWRLNCLKKILSEEEAEVFVMATGMTEMGNVPMEADVKREYFKMNCLYRAMDLEQVAIKTGRKAVDVELLYERARVKVLEDRNRRLHAINPVIDSEALSSFRMVNAYVALYRATGDETYSGRALELLTKARGVFADGVRLKTYVMDTTPEIQPARAFIYGLAIQAALDVAAISQDEEWLDWADGLMSEVSERFLISGRLVECPVDVDVLGMPVSNNMMMIEESTEGLFSILQARMASLGRSVPTEITESVRGLPQAALSHPVSHTDMIQGSLIRHYGDRIFYGENIDENLEKSLRRLSPKLAVVISGKTISDVPKDGVMVIQGNGEMKSAGNPHHLLDSYLRKSSESR